MPQSQGTRFTADPLTFIVRHQLWDGNVEDHVGPGRIHRRRGRR